MFNSTKSYLSKFFLTACTIALSVLVWTKPFVAVGNVANAATIDRLPAVLAVEGIVDKVQGKAEQDIGTVQKNIGKVTGQAEGSLKQARGKAKQDIGETKNRLDNAGKDLKDSSESFVDSVKDLFGQ